MNAHIERKISAYRRKFPSVKDLHVVKSDRPGKRLKATFTLNGKLKTVHFGLHGAVTWADGAPREKRDSYRARASRIKNAAGRNTYLIPGTANSFAYWVLW